MTADDAPRSGASKASRPPNGVRNRSEEQAWDAEQPPSADLNPYQSATPVDDFHQQIVGDLPEITMHWLFLKTEGRIPRRGLWFGTGGLAVMCVIVVSLVLAATQWVLARGVALERILLPVRIILASALLVLGWCEWALICKRYHDRGRSVAQSLFGLASLSAFVVVILCMPVALPPWVNTLITGGIVFAFIDLGLLRGTAGPNRFGFDPTNDLRCGAVIPHQPASARASDLPAEVMEPCPYCEAVVFRTRWDTCPKCDRPI